MPLPATARKTAQDFWSLPDGVRAELIDGQLWDLASPSRKHQEIVLKLGNAIDTFIESHDGPCKVYPAPFAVNLFDDDSTFVEPDISVICDRSKLSERGCEGAPDLVVEIISPSNPSMDYVSKLALYQAAGVREYWICDPLRCRTFVYGFGSDDLVSVYTFDDPVPSSVLAGFTIRFADVVAGM